MRAPEDPSAPRGAIATIVAGFALGDLWDPYPQFDPLRAALGALACVLGWRGRFPARPALLFGAVAARFALELLGDVREPGLDAEAWPRARAAAAALVVAIAGRWLPASGAPSARGAAERSSAIGSNAATPSSARLSTALLTAAVAVALGAVVAASLYAHALIALRATAHGPEDVLVLFLVGAVLLAIGAFALAPALRRALGVCATEADSRVPRSVDSGRAVPPHGESPHGEASGAILQRRPGPRRVVLKDSLLWRRLLGRAHADMAASVPLAAAAAVSVAMLAVTAGVTAPRGFAALCARIGASPGDFGTLAVDALLFASVFAAPLLLVGAALAVSGRLFGALLGAALLARPLHGALFDFDAASLASAEASLGSVAVVARASALAGLLVLALAARRGARALALAAGGALLALGLALPLSPIHVAPPFRHFPVDPLFVFEGPAGQVAVEPAALPGAAPRPGLGRSTERGARVLLDQHPVPVPAEPPQALLTLDASVARAAGSLARRDTTRPLAHTRERWALEESDGLRAFSLVRASAVVDGAALTVRTEGAVPSVLDWLRTPVRERERVALRSITERLDAPPELAPLAAFLVEHARIQRISSPFESADEAIELDHAALQRLAAHIASRNSFTRLERSVVEGVADALVAQREVPWIFELLGPVAEAHGPWPGVARALAHAADEER